MDAVEVGNTIIGVVGEVALKAGETALIADFPFLGIWPLSMIWEYFANKYAEKVIVELQKGDANIIIHITDANEAKDAKKAADALSTATPETEDAAREEFKKRYGDLVRTRVATP